MSKDNESQEEPEEKFYQEYLRLVERKGAGAVDEMLDAIKKTYGAVPLVARVLSEEKDYFLSSVIKSRSILNREDGPLDPKTVELIVIASATALRCDHCLEVHIKQARKYGATKEEILQAIMIACFIMESSGRATAFRKYRQAFGKKDAAAEENGESGQ